MGDWGGGSSRKFLEETYCSERAANCKLMTGCQEKQSPDKSVEADAIGTHERRKALGSRRPGFEFGFSYLFAAWLKVVIYHFSFSFLICKTRPNNIHPFSVVVWIKCKDGDRATGQSWAPCLQMVAGLLLPSTPPPPP